MEELFLALSGIVPGIMFVSCRLEVISTIKIRIRIPRVASKCMMYV